MEQVNGIAVTDNTGEQQAPRWQPGESGNPSGRPKGSRNRISEAALKALADDFDAHGVAVIEKVRTERTHDYLKIIVAVLPRRMEIEDSNSARPASDMSDDELAAIAGGARHERSNPRGCKPKTQNCRI
jgi:hypothetical protein